MSTLFWLRRIGLMLWLETVGERRKFIAKTVVFAIVAVLFWLMFAAIMATISQANQSLGSLYTTMAATEAKKLGKDPIAVPRFDKKYSVSQETGQILLKLIKSDYSKNTDPYDPPSPVPRTVEERLANEAYTAKRNLEKYKNDPRLQVYTNDLSLWPHTVRGPVESMFGPVLETDEETYLNTLQRKGNAWVGVRNDKGVLHWRGWGPASFLNVYADSQALVLQNYIGAVGEIYQKHYLDEIRETPQYQSLPHWEGPVIFPTFTPIDVRALSLFFVLAVFVFPTLLAASQAITWDFNRNKNVYEPYATMKIPVWGVLLKESLSGFWYLVIWAVITAMLCGLVVSLEPSYWALLMSMIALGLGGCWLNLQINMFLVVTFQTPVGRQLARVLVMPFFFLPYHLFRVFGATEILQILDGKSLEQFNWVWIWGATATCFAVGVAVLRLAAWRVGLYRKGLAPS